MHTTIGSLFDHSGIPIAKPPLRHSTARLESVAHALTDAGSALLLLGEPGTGKQSLANQSAQAFTNHHGTQLTEIPLPEPPLGEHRVGYVFSRAFPEVARLIADAERAGSLGPEDETTIGATLLESIRRRSGEHEALIIAPGIDAYSPASEQLLRLLLRSRRFRIVMTAHRLSAAADHLMRLPHVSTITLGPLTMHEAQEYASQILHVERVEHATLKRWLELTTGNAYALAMLIYACDRKGKVHRQRGVAWSNPGDEEVPEELEQFLLDTCTPEELHALQLIAVAEPVHEMPLIQSIHTDALQTLHDRGLVKTQMFETDGMSLRIAHPLLTAAVLSRMPVHERIELQARVFELLSASLSDPNRHVGGIHLLRLVRFGLQSAQPIPQEWIERALLILARAQNPRLMIELSVTYAEHPDRDESRAATYLTRAHMMGRHVGDPPLIMRLVACMQTLLTSGSLSPAARLQLEVALTERDWREGAEQFESLSRLDDLESQAQDTAPDMLEAIRDLRPVFIVGNGDLRAGIDLAQLSPHTDLGSLRRHPVSALVRAMGLLQEGHISEAMRITESASHLLNLEPEAEFHLIELHSFLLLLGHWLLADATFGRERLERVLDTVDNGIHPQWHQPGLTELLLALFTMQEGRMRLATQKAERLRDHLAAADPYGIAPLVNALLANTLAVLGETESARHALQLSTATTRGLSQALGGVHRILSSQALLWLQPETAAISIQRHAAWARETRLPLVELRLTHLLACATASISTDDVIRASSLAAAVDSPVAQVIVEHLSWIHLHAGTPDLNVSNPEQPEVRLLASAGIILPLRLGETLTTREREVALLATLGYQTRHISQMLHISPRTVETHLGRVFQKLGVTGRDELRSVESPFDLYGSDTGVSGTGISETGSTNTE